MSVILAEIKDVKKIVQPMSKKTTWTVTAFNVLDKAQEWTWKVFEDEPEPFVGRLYLMDTATFVNGEIQLPYFRELNAMEILQFRKVLEK